MNLKVSEHLVFFYKDGHYVCDNYVDHIQKSLNPSIVPILQFFSTWKERDDVYILIDTNPELTRDFLNYAIENLITENILIEENSSEHLLQKKSRIWNQWGTASKYFHFNTRLKNNDKFHNKEEQYNRLKEKKKLIKPPSIYKRIEGSAKIKLPPPKLINDNTFLNTLLGRQTIRDLDNKKPITLENISSLIYLVFGIQASKREIGVDQVIFKTSPSGGSRHPIEVYPCIINVEGLKPGIYHYSTQDHSLEIIKNGVFDDLYVDMAAQQEYVKKASVLFFYTACIERTMWKYLSPRSYRVIMMDLGHLSQTFYLTSNWLKLGAFFTAHLKDELVEEQLNVEFNKEIVLGLSGVGYPSLEAKIHGRDFRLIGELNNENY